MSNGSEARLESAAPRAVDLDAIERELAHLWDEPDGGVADNQLSRACMSNLVIVCDCAEDATAVSQQLPLIAQQHPSRVLLVLTGAANQSDAIDAFVSAQCYRSSGGRQICSEQVTIRAHSDAAHRLPSIVRALVIGDLPTAVWWDAEATPAANPLFDELADVADQVIYDSANWAASLSSLKPVLTRALALDADIAGADLAWQRLQPWMQLISLALDPDELPGAIDAITEVVIEHGASGLAESLLIAGWLASRLGWEASGSQAPDATGVTWKLRGLRSQPALTIRQDANGAAASLRTVKIRSNPARGPIELTFTSPAAGQLEVAATGVTLPLKLHRAPTPDDAALVAIQLSELGRDAVFHEALVAATNLATAAGAK